MTQQPHEQRWEQLTQNILKLLDSAEIMEGTEVIEVDERLHVLNESAYHDYEPEHLAQLWFGIAVAALSAFLGFSVADQDEAMRAEFVRMMAVDEE